MTNSQIKTAKTEITETLNGMNVEVKRVSFFDGHTPKFKVSINWTDYLKVRDCEFTHNLNFCF